MASRKGIDHKALEKKITDLSKALANLDSSADLKKLILLMRRPGWTTPAEFAFATALADTLLAHTKVVASTTQALLAASKAVALEG